MQGKTVVITGGTSGVGQVAAERLASMGARIVLIGRDKARTTEQLRALAPGSQHTAYHADLSSLHEVRRVAAEIASAEPRIDALAKRLSATRVTVNAWNPGPTKTRFYDNKPLYLRLFSKLIAGDPKERAETLVHLASAPELATTTGEFWAYMKPGKMSKISQDDSLAEECCGSNQNGLSLRRWRRRGDAHGPAQEPR